MVVYAFKLDLDMAHDLDTQTMYTQFKPGVFNADVCINGVRPVKIRTLTRP